MIAVRDWELEPAYNATLEDLDWEWVNAFLARRASSGRQSGRFKDATRVLIGMRCAVEVSGGTVVPTNAGLFFSGRVHKIIFRKARLCVSYFEKLLGPAAMLIAKS
jgi:predicted HTH transcriptional regulator